jgi:hypothetical protein
MRHPHNPLPDGMPVQGADAQQGIPGDAGGAIPDQFDLDPDLDEIGDPGANGNAGESPWTGMPRQTPRFAFNGNGKGH